MTDIIRAHMGTSLQGPNPSHSPLRKAAIELESAFLAEMLKSAGLGKSRESMGGGAGEDQFGSLLVRAQADQIAQGGGIGLAETIFKALKETNHD
jgi:Rod binding domain-containing protein